MRFKICNLSLYVVLAMCGAAAQAEAQAPLGTRAQGMGGAFVGVADDASAVYWNPAGLATGAIVSFVASFADESTTPEGAQAIAAERRNGRIVALSFLPVGIAYYRVGVYGTSIGAPAVSDLPSREEVRRSVQAFTTSTLGVSLLQSVTDYIVVAATPKLVRGAAARGLSSAVRADEALDEASDLDGQNDTAFDLDAAVMIAVEHLRVGVVGRHLVMPSFEVSDGGEIELQREVRVGIGWGTGWPGASRLSVSVDGDILSRVTPFGDRRDVAAGVETWWRNGTIALRAGARRSTIGAARAAVTGGASYAVRPGVYVDGHAVTGDLHERGWGLGLRMGF